MESNRTISGLSGKPKMTKKKKERKEKVFLRYGEARGDRLHGKVLSQGTNTHVKYKYKRGYDNSYRDIRPGELKIITTRAIS